jgi:hypothetical protein
MKFSVVAKAGFTNGLSCATMWYEALCLWEKFVRLE